MRTTTLILTLILTSTFWASACSAPRVRCVESRDLPRPAAAAPVRVPDAPVRVPPPKALPLDEGCPDGT